MHNITTKKKTYINSSIPTVNIDVQTPNKRMANIPNRKIQVGALNRKGLETIELPWDGDKHLECDGLLQFFL